MTDFDGPAARAWRDAFPRPIVTVRMTAAAYADAWAAAGPAERADLTAGVESGQIIITIEPVGDQP